METKVEIPFDAKLPEFYVNEVHLRMEMYQRLGDASSTEEVDAIFDELRDRFGQPPEQALWLYHFSRLRVIAAQKGYTLIKVDNLTLITEKKSGTETTSNRVLLGRIKSPQDLEEKINKFL
jgi:transcription-repair coupling factor (superfamily II helicase)